MPIDEDGPHPAARAGKGDTPWPIHGLTARDYQNAKSALRQQEMDRAVAEGRLVIRRMTPAEREQSDARFAAAAGAREGRAEHQDRRSLGGLAPVLKTIVVEYISQRVGSVATH